MMIPASALALLRVAALAPALSLTGPSDLAAQAPGALYVRRDECIEAGRLTAEGVRSSTRPAAEKLPSATTMANISSERARSA